MAYYNYRLSTLLSFVTKCLRSHIALNGLPIDYTTCNYVHSNMQISMVNPNDSEFTTFLNSFCTTTLFLTVNLLLYMDKNI